MQERDIRTGEFAPDEVGLHELPLQEFQRL